MIQFDSTAIQKFWSMVDKNGPTVRDELGPCWMWIGGSFMRGYGVFHFSKTRYMRAHRLSWILHHNRDIPAGRIICHKCDIPGCVNPEHLFDGTNDDNMKDKTRKGRAYRGQSHYKTPLTDDLVREIFSKCLTAKHGDGRRLAKEYGVLPACISAIKHRRNWKHIN